MLARMSDQHADGGLIVPPLLAVCAAELLERIDALADDLFRKITTEVAPYARLSDEIMADVRDFNERNLRELLTCMAHHRPVRTDSTRQSVRRRATQGSRSTRFCTPSSSATACWPTPSSTVPSNSPARRWTTSHRPPWRSGPCWTRRPGR